MQWFLSLFLLCLIPFSANASAEDFDYNAFGQMPILNEGRIKPLDSLARVMVMRICGSTECANRAPTPWLAFMLFKPQNAVHEPMFAIGSNQAVNMLGLPARADHRYSFEALASILPAHGAFIEAIAQKDKSALSGDEAEVLRLYSATNDFAEIIGTFSLLAPLAGMDDSLRTQLHISHPLPLSYFDLQKYRTILAEALRKNPQAKALTKLSTQMTLQETVDRDNRLLRIIPPAWGGEEWLSPWAVLKSSSGSPHNAELLRAWSLVGQSYRSGDISTWNQTTHALLAQSLGTLDPLLVWRLFLEYTYHELHLLLCAVVAYGLGIFLIGMGAMPRFARLLPLGNASLIAGMLLHATALVMRMLILMRPPVSTLYESLLFVSFIVMVASGYVGWKRHAPPGLLAGAVTALGLLLASWVFAGSGDTLGVLVAVLNTNFWLATHVVCITTGYGTALITGAIAHVYLFRSSIRKASETILMPLFTLLHRAALIALLFTATGTMLGGIWADQSWGRFWGWDPKENGALLIVLWLVWLLHGLIAKQLSRFSFAALMALVNVVVAVAWIGVNLLSVGLHSYGFTDAAATGLLAFCAVEFAYVAVMVAVRRITFTVPISA